MAAIAGAGRWLGAAGSRLRRAARALFPAAWPQMLLAERDQWMLWLPVCLGSGIGLYFALPVSPPPLPLLLLTMLMGLLWLWLVWRRPEAGMLLLAPWLALAGFSLIAWRAADVAAPVLERRMAAVVEGRIVLNEPRDHGHRLTLEALWIERLQPQTTPRRVRITLAHGGAELHPGQRVRLRALLSPPAGPAMPGAFDFARAAWFQRIGAVGSAHGVAEILLQDVALTLPEQLSLWLNRQQQALAGRITAALGGTDGAIAAALMTGVRGPIPDDVDVAFRDSGLAHILSISGLHLVLVGGILFAAMRALLAASPYIALHWPIKKLAALAALAGTAAYMLLSGSALATQRSFVMVALGFVAILVDRRALSLRSVALAALVILLLAPESLLDAGLQMSFGAVLALVAGFEAVEPWLSRWRLRAGPLRTALLWLLGAMLTSLVAGFGSGLFAAYHFNRFADYALLANLIASPLVSFWIMPLAMLAFLLMPLGLEQLALVPMGWGVEALTGIARWVAGWPGAVITLPAMPGWCLPAMALGLAWLCLWRLPWRWLGLPPLLAALIAPWLVAAPDLLISADARRIAVRAPDGGGYYFSSGAAQTPPRGFEAETWWRRLGGPALPPWPSVRRGFAATPDGVLRCDAGGCTGRLKGWVIAIPRDEQALMQDCRGADILLAAFPVRQRCPSARLIIDRFDVWRQGAMAVYLNARGDLRVTSVAEDRAGKPWVPPRGHNAASLSEDSRRRRGEASIRMDDAGGDDDAP